MHDNNTFFGDELILIMFLAFNRHKTNNTVKIFLTLK
jgi:hypothetical protein